MTSLGRDFLKKTNSTIHTKENIITLAFKKIKIQTTDWEKIFAKHITDKGLESRIDKELFQLSNKTDRPIKNGQRI